MQSLTSDPGFAKAHVSRQPLLAAVHFADLDYEVRVVHLSCNIVRRILLARPSYDLNTQLDLVCVTAIDK
ncbi:hypothetical protein BAE44_0023775 [Dichanthelium oligosanthes]|uniref:Uncharacterized protein n=1 Tax=Dichanthelium oligosanthes TaxID=888268 RepID=A0A1E5UQX0_9POAL|nr:hypothetical protein BAE44_0023775 [Dichanthelium oligosanthes]